MINGLNQSYNDSQIIRDSSHLKSKGPQQIIDKIFLPQNISQHRDQSERVHKHTKTPDITTQNIIQQSQVITSQNAASGLYQQIKNKNFEKNAQLIAKNLIDINTSQQSKAVVKFQQSSTKKSSRENNNSGRNSQRGTRYESFFSQRNNMQQSKENLKQVIKIYKDGVIKQDEVIPLPQTKKSIENINNFKVSQRNISVPRGQNHKNILQSQDYTACKEKPLSKLDKINFNKKEALNNSTGNVKLSELGIGAYGTDNITQEDIYKQSALLNNGQSLLSQTKNTNPYQKQKTAHGSYLQATATLKSCYCPCQCGAQQDTQLQTANNMTSIISMGGKRQNINTMTLRFGQGFITTTGGQSTTVMIDEPGEASNMEEMHYLMVNVEKIKKKMLGSVEGIEDPNLDYQAFHKMQMEQKNNEGSESPQRESIENTNNNLVCYE